MPAAIRILVQVEDFDLGGEVEDAKRRSAGVGAIVAFIGTCRDEGGRLMALELEHYPGMAEAEIARIAETAAARWPLAAITVIHRHGRIVPGENIVLVVTIAAHRDAAFDAANFLMDFMKTNAPFWKREHLAGKGPGAWVAAKDDDTAAAERW